MSTTSQTYTFHVSGMHCHSCVLMTESELTDLPYVSHAKTTLKTNSVTVTGDFGDKSKEEVAALLTKVLSPKGYTLSVFEIKETKEWDDFKIAIPVALLFAIAFVLLQKTGLVNLISGDGVSYGTAFMIGIVASLSTCMAVVGGLVLSMSATFAREGDKIRPQVLFHVGRLAAFFFLGGVIGSLGAVFQLSTVATFVLSVLIGVVMLVMGINLLGVFRGARRFQIGMPQFISKHALGVSKLNHTLTPLLVGIVTFFLPCGFTQSMQLYTLGAGDFLSGGLTMFVFALGTLPVLSLVSFSSLAIHENKNAGVFFKTAGLIVIMFALFNLANSLAVIGIIPPLFNF
ncbi:MAG: hypothetical protein A2494_02470 [Candidatus Lloydbacteria bacterium RIFOXYC12_FULL_46_25]|uniref:HMA domain-containing protein n=1 Tax=Candidatus Lloydbacteria bacterium RIFOXYC12_FULL_46_25 TaxID=1798670 RepID=A0A1G2E3G3_9BACT|nr:MAG: hypothetical protein A2494_02470 [Candidatus Lloydbacteria bacterium RIFOXYC12_FULL_46_25]